MTAVSWNKYGNPSRAEKELKELIEEDQWEELKKSATDTLNTAETEAEINESAKQMQKLSTYLESWKKSHPVESYDLEKKLTRRQAELSMLDFLADFKAKSLKRQAEADFCLAHCESASTPEEIEASIPHASLFQGTQLTDKDFKRIYRMTREQWDSDYKARMIAFPRDQRVKSIKAVINSERDLENDPTYIKYRERQDRLRAEIREIERGENEKKAVDALNDIGVATRQATAVAQQAAFQQHADAERSRMQQHEDAINNQPILPPLPNTYHSGTILFNNGASATYHGY